MMFLLFVTGWRYSSHSGLSIWSLHDGGHVAEDWSQRSRPAECKLSLHTCSLPSGPTLPAVRNMIVRYDAAGTQLLRFLQTAESCMTHMEQDYCVWGHNNQVVT